MAVRRGGFRPLDRGTNGDNGLVGVLLSVLGYLVLLTLAIVALVFVVNNYNNISGNGEESLLELTQCIKDNVTTIIDSKFPSCPPQVRIEDLIILNKGDVPITGAVNGETFPVFDFHHGRPGRNFFFIHGDPFAAKVLYKNVVMDGTMRDGHNMYGMDFRGLGEAGQPPVVLPPGEDPPTSPVYRPSESVADDIKGALDAARGFSGFSTTNNKFIMVLHSASGLWFSHFIRQYPSTWEDYVEGIVFVDAWPEPYLGTGPFFFTTKVAVAFSSLPSPGYSQAVADALGGAEVGMPLLYDLMRLMTYCVPDIETFSTFIASSWKPNAQVYAANRLIAGANATLMPGPIQFLGDPWPGSIQTVNPATGNMNEGVWGSVTMPTLVIHGVSDDILKHAETIAYFQAFLGGPVTVESLPGIGHLPFIECPQDFVAKILAYEATLT